ncbi:ferredoxin [Alkalihalobacterium elongatum]|uniref:ferredoxin n=1 Tax=Alkalihalobacterium elongatum TaxID=2675466 RepID=UPI002E2B441C|nr:ferredoxin [Alkalihalobacterium elongatum]
MKEDIKVTVDRSKCVGTMTCMYASKGIFYLREGKAEVKNSESHSAESIMETAELCPVSAITVIDENTGKQLFP